MTSADDTRPIARQATDPAPAASPGTADAARAPGSRTATPAAPGTRSRKASGKPADDGWVAGFPDAPRTEKKSRKGVALGALIALAAMLLVVGGFGANYLHHRAAVAADAHTSVRTPTRAGGLTRVDNNASDAWLHQRVAPADLYEQHVGATYQKPGTKTPVYVWGGVLPYTESETINDHGDLVGGMSWVDAPDSIGGGMRCGAVQKIGPTLKVTTLCTWGNHKAAVAFMAVEPIAQLADTAAAMLPDLVHRA